MRAGDTGFDRMKLFMLFAVDDHTEWSTPKSERPRCGARCRDGHPCRAPVIWDHENNRPRNGRCRIHGGLSTGPKTLEGKLRALANLRQFGGSASPV